VSALYTVVCARSVTNGANRLGVAYNALPGQQLQSGFQEWASKAFRDAWADLSKRKRRVTELGLCQFKIDRTMKASDV
jgi:hypothetical protein